MQNTPHLTETQRAWLAGLYEGEGNASIARNGGTRLTIRMTDRDIIERVQAMYPGSPIQHVKRQRENWKDQYAWRVSNPEKVREFLGLIMPWLGERRMAKAIEVIQHLDTRPGTGSNMRNKTHCPHGHEYTPDNILRRHGWDKDGKPKSYRRCRECHNIAAAKRRAAKQVAKQQQPFSDAPAT